MKKELTHEIKKEVINARLKSFETYPSSSGFPPISTLRPPSSLAVDSVPSTTRYTSPRKRNSSSASASSSPVLGFSSSQSGSFAVRTSGGRAMGASPIGSQILPFSSSDLTIRPTSQPLTSPFLNDSTSKQSSKSASAGSTSSDGDVFKKPAPVSGVRSFH